MTTAAPAGGSPPARREPPASAHTGLLRIREELPAWQAWVLGLVPVALLLLAAGCFKTVAVDPQELLKLNPAPGARAPPCTPPVCWTMASLPIRTGPALPTYCDRRRRLHGICTRQPVIGLRWIFLFAPNCKESQSRQ